MLSTKLINFQRALIKIPITRIGYGIRNSSSLEQEAQKFLAKHSKRASPQSPYMLGTTYKIQLTSALSLTHRITGVGLGLLIYGFGIAEILSPSKNFAQLLDSYYSILPSIGPDILKLFCGKNISRDNYNLFTIIIIFRYCTRLSYL